MPRKGSKFIGWMVLCYDPATGLERKVYRAASEADARETVRRLNALVMAGRTDPVIAATLPLYWCEWWSTNSSLALGGRADRWAAS
jgi:hypothetical protein